LGGGTVEADFISQPYPGRSQPDSREVISGFMLAQYLAPLATGWQESGDAAL
jgi:hypothetical protein